MMRIGLASLFVDDQLEAERFYTDIVGFRVKTNVAYGPTERWLTVVAADEPDGVQVVLHLADDAARVFRAANAAIGRPLLSIMTEDCFSVAERLKARGVSFVKDPARMDYGGVDAVFSDPSGNLINLHED
jgi:catechol 2,3-dioxygenase-like lactoylglutathione lyase family enzyme